MSNKRAFRIGVLSISNLIGPGLTGHPLGTWDALSWAITQNTSAVTADWELTGGSGGYPSAFFGSAPWWGALGIILQPSPNLPTVSSVSPATGYVGTPVTITGTYLTGATAVDFGSASAGFTVVSDTEITCLAPAGTATVQASVTTPDGTSSQDVTFEYDVPVQLAVSLSRALMSVTLS